MNQLLDFFIEPYKTAPFLDIILEVTAVVFGISSVVYAKNKNILVFPTGIISTAIYIFICFKYTLYGDLIINIYYTLMSIYGWYMWSKMINDHHLPITTCSRKDWVKTSGIFAFTALFVILIYKYSDRFDRMTDYFDTLTTGIFFAGMWLMANKKLENWIFWIVGNIISIPLYFVKGLGFTGLQFTVFLILAYYGYISWKKTLDNKLQISLK